jgi:hypothetical protein
MAKLTTHVVLDAADEEHLKEIADRDGVSKSAALRQMIRRSKREAMVTSMPSPGDRRGARESR